MIDKKNENKEVAVEDFLPAEAAIDAIKYSMWDKKFSSSLFTATYDNCKGNLNISFLHFS